jgi:flagellar basal body-associated protein FliL
VIITITIVVIAAVAAGLKAVLFIEKEEKSREKSVNPQS